MAASSDRLIELVDRHERLLSKVLDMPMLKESRFPDFQGAVKSLGAWGGDFFMAVSEQGLGYSKAYFRGKGYGVMFPFEKLAKSKTM